MARLPYKRSYIRTPPPDLLSRFLSLDIEKPREVLGYARKYGILRIGCCGRPATGHAHKTKPLVIRGETGDILGSIPNWGVDESTCEPIGWEIDRDAGLLKGWEPLGAWRYYVRRARSILNCAHRIRQNRIADKADIETILDQIPSNQDEVEVWADVRRIRPDILDRYTRGEYKTWEYHRDLVKRALAEWHALASGESGAVKFALVWTGNDVEYSVDTNHFGAIGFQLGLALAKSEDMAICSGCAQVYIPPRRPKPGQRHYCEICRRRMIPQRDAMRDFRQRARKGPKTVVKTVGELSTKQGKTREKPRKRKTR